MGIYDRDYYRDDDGASGSQWTMVAKLIAINAAIYILQLLSQQRDTEFGAYNSDSLIQSTFHLEQQWFRQPWKVFQLLTYGFLHDPNNFKHILFNMIGLWFFGTKLEYLYGRREFLRIYFSGIVFSGAIWNAVEMAVSRQGESQLLGASGGVMALVILYGLNFPRDVFYVFGIIPAQAWVICGFYIAMDILGVFSPTQRGNESKVAHIAHLGGALGGYIYYRTRFTLFSLWPRRWSWNPMTRNARGSTRLRIHDDEPDEEHATTKDFQSQVDDILAKITRSGESSLTPEERRTLEEASRRYQQRRS